MLVHFSIGLLRVARLAMLTLRLLPASSEGEVAFRLQIALACTAATDDPVEQTACVKIPRFESGYRQDVATCLVVGTFASSGLWQVIPRSGRERASLCTDLQEAAVIALGRARESRAMCRQLPDREQLAAYACGRCGPAECRRLSTVRWPLPEEIVR